MQIAVRRDDLSVDERRANLVYSRSNVELASPRCVRTVYREAEVHVSFILNV